MNHVELLNILTLSVRPTLSYSNDGVIFLQQKDDLGFFSYFYGIIYWIGLLMGQSVKKKKFPLSAEAAIPGPK